jgi:hypothetical protein
MDDRVEMMKRDIQVVPTMFISDPIIRNRNMRLYDTCIGLYNTLHVCDERDDPEEQVFFEEVRESFMVLGRRIMALPQYADYDGVLIPTEKVLRNSPMAGLVGCPDPEEIWDGESFDRCDEWV